MAFFAKPQHLCLSIFKLRKAKRLYQIDTGLVVTNTVRTTLKVCHVSFDQNNFLRTFCLPLKQVTFTVQVDGLVLPIFIIRII